MRITFNTSQPHAACSMFYAYAFATSIEHMCFGNQDFSSYDVALFMTYDHSSIESIRKKFPHLKIGIIDPRNKEVEDAVKHCDFIIVDSIEMEDYWRRSGIPIFRYAEYPNIPYVKKSHVDKDTVVVGYHGNLIHLDCMSENVTPALSRLGKTHNIELHVMYNGTPPDGTERWYPENVTVKHIQWSMENYVKYLALCDIGVVPNNIIHNVKEKSSMLIDRKYNYSDDDYSLRFKMPSNPGRFIVFGKLNIPVVADFYPSALQYLGTEIGFVANSVSGWEHCLKRLIESPNLRQSMGDNLQNLIRREFDFEKQNKNFLDFLKPIVGTSYV